MTCECARLLLDSIEAFILIATLFYGVGKIIMFMMRNP